MAAQLQWPNYQRLWARLPSRCPDKAPFRHQVENHPPKDLVLPDSAGPELPLL